MKDRIGDGCADARNADLADAAAAERLEFCVGDIKRVDLDLSDVGVDGDMVLSEIVVHGTAVPRIDVRRFLKRQAHAPDDAADKLAFAGSLVKKRADVVDGNDTMYVDHSRELFHSHLSKHHAPGVRRVLLDVLTSLRALSGADRLVAIAREEVLEVLARAGTIPAADHAILEFKLIGLDAGERTGLLI